MIRLIIFSLLISFLLVSCGDDDNGTSPVDDEARIRLIHLSYDTPALDLEWDDEVINTGLSYLNTSGYISVKEGNFALESYETGKPNNQHFFRNININEGESYTAFLLNKKEFVNLEITNDPVSIPASKILLRVVQGVPDMFYPVDIKLRSPERTIEFNNINFLDISDYIEADPGNFELTVIRTDTGEEILSFNAAKLRAGNSYTLTAAGTLNTADDYGVSMRAFIDNKDTEYVDFTTDAPGLTDLRLVHLDYEIGPVDFRVNNELKAESISYMNSSGYTEAEAVDAAITATEAGNSNKKYIDFNHSLITGLEYTVFMYNQNGSSNFQISDETPDPVPGNVKIRVFNAAPDLGPFDVRKGAQGNIIFSDIESFDMRSYQQTSFGLTEFVFTNSISGEELTSFIPVNLIDGNAYTIIISGTMDDGDNYPLRVRLLQDNEGGSQFIELVDSESETARIKIFNGHVDHGLIDIKKDNGIIYSGLSYSETTPYLHQQTGSAKFTVTESAGSNLITDLSLNLSAGQSLSAFVYKGGNKTEILPVPDIYPTIDPGKAMVRLVHIAETGPLSVDLFYDTGALFENVRFENFESYVQIDPDDYTFTLTQGVEDLAKTDASVETGRYYTIIFAGEKFGEGGTQYDLYLVEDKK
ncbi:MAG: DUF4397 domain-containing protein [Candidatus Kapaibacterium sp.]